MIRKTLIASSLVLVGFTSTISAAVQPMAVPATQPTSPATAAAAAVPELDLVGAAFGDFRNHLAKGDLAAARAASMVAKASPAAAHDEHLQAMAEGLKDGLRVDLLTGRVEGNLAVVVVRCTSKDGESFHTPMLMKKVGGAWKVVLSQPQETLAELDRSELESFNLLKAWTAQTQRAIES